VSRCLFWFSHSNRNIFYLRSQLVRIILWLMISYKLRIHYSNWITFTFVYKYCKQTNGFMDVLFCYLILFFYNSDIFHKCIYHVVFFTTFAVFPGLRFFERRRFHRINETTENIGKPFDVYFQRFNIRVQWLWKKNNILHLLSAVAIIFFWEVGGGHILFFIFFFNARISTYYNIKYIHIVIYDYRYTFFFLVNIQLLC